MMDDPLIGRVIGGHRLERLLGRGGMAAVYLAWDEKLRRQVVVKVMLPFQAGDDSFQARFQQEAFATARLSHPNIVHIYDLGQQADLTYMVMEFLPGGSLHDLIRNKGRVEPAQAVSIISQIALALDYAHQNGIIHRDVKPANILFAKDGRPVLTDLGIAKALEGPRLTRAMLAVGTPEYMSPEQGRGDPVDGRSDLYSLGIVLYELLSGVLPYQADTPWGIIYKHMSEPLPPIQKANGDVSLALRSVVEKALAKHPEDRFQAGREMADALRRALETPGKRLYAPPPMPVMTPAPPVFTPASTVTPDAKTKFMRTEDAVQASGARAKTGKRGGIAWRWIIVAGLVIYLATMFAMQRLSISRSQLPAAPVETPAPTLTATPASVAPTVTLAPTKKPSAAGSVPQVVVAPVSPAATEPLPTPQPVPSTDTPIPATATLVPSATLAPPTATSIPPTATSLPSPTRPVATSTRVVSTATRPAPSPSPRPAASAALPAPILLSPAAGESVTGQTAFSWNWTGPALGTNQAFEVRIWKEGQADHYGAHEPVTAMSVTLSVRGAYGVQQGGSGTYFWTAAVVQREPYSRIGPEAEPRTLIVQGGSSAPDWTPPPP